jgi:3-methyladenine DNA glycosylase Tag
MRAKPEGGAKHSRIVKPSLSDYLAVMSRAVFQAGLSWAAIDHQWNALLDTFEGFDPRTVARYGDKDVRRIMSHDGILHSERKIRATIANARALLELDRQHRGFRSYLRSHRSYDDLTGDLRRHFKFVGDVSAYYFLYRVGETVPPFGRWIKTVEGEHPRIREMVTAGKT